MTSCVRMSCGGIAEQFWPVENHSQLERGEVDLLSFLFLLNTQHTPFLLFDFSNG